MVEGQAAAPVDVRRSRGPGVRRLAWLGVVVAALVLAPASLAAGKQFWYGPYDQIGEDISGLSDLHVQMEDDPGEWSSIESAVGVPDGESLLGFATITAPPGDALYHQIFLSPQVTLSLAGTLALNPTGAGTSMIWDRIDDGTLSYDDAAIAILTLIHEAYHYRLDSGDESRVNACALRDMPTYLSSEFHIPQTITTTVQVPQTVTTTKQVPYFVTVVTHRKVRGRLVAVRKRIRRYKSVVTTTTTMVSQQQTEENPVFDGIMAAATAFRLTQPPPYNSGDCY